MVGPIYIELIYFKLISMRFKFASGNCFVKANYVSFQLKALGFPEHLVVQVKLDH